MNAIETKKKTLNVAHKKFTWERLQEEGTFLDGKPVPQATELEQVVLGAILQDSKAIDKVKDILSVESFYEQSHQLIFSAIQDLKEQSKAIDMLTVAQQLKQKNQLKKVGGPYYLTELTGRVASGANSEFHAKIIQQKHIAREMIKISYYTIKHCYEDNLDVFDIHDWASREFAQSLVNQEWRQQELLKSIKQERSKTKNPYPTHVFPARIVRLIEDFAYCKNIPISFLFSSLLTVASSAIGNGLRMQYRSDYKSSVALYMALVAPPGIGKTWAIKLMAKPLLKRDRELQEIHKLAMEGWRERKSDWEADARNLEPFSEPMPHCQQTFVDDFTMESLVKVFLNNKKGTFGLMDELIALFNSLNAYRNKGSDGQKFLKIFDGSEFKINRSNGEPVTIWSTFMSLIGGIQPDVLQQMASGGRIGDGTMGRFNFDYPEMLSRPDPNNNEIRDGYIEEYHEIMEYIMNLPTHYNDQEQIRDDYDLAPIGIQFTDAAREAYFQWLIENNKKYNATDQESEQTVHVKSENQCLRFALLIQVIIWACDNKKIDSSAALAFLRVDVEALKAAFELIEYYRHCSLKVLDKLESPLSKLKAEYIAIYKGVEAVFHINDMLKLAKAAGISDASVRRHIIRNKELIHPITGKAGMYQKKIAS